ncbi:MAG: di-trans,poly-cis-decaprenylcistransferase [Alphaproteobacteria bacterium]|nr:MAG: di-trans,poly-cis-decaprenylcistransferase [Alphaproteobacteria bacterium]
MGFPLPNLKTRDESPPHHVAIIMDGNGRWATKRGLPRVEGHRQGAEALRRTVEASIDLGISQLTVFAFSTENWKRTKQEISGLFSLIRFYVKRELNDLIKNGVCLKIIGDYRAFPKDVVQILEDACAKTASFTRIGVCLALNYGGQQDIAAAVKKIALDVEKGKLVPADIGVDTITENLSTAQQNLSAPDLLIRTSGERRLSNFLLWQLSYAEMVFQDVYWPDYNKEHFEDALAQFASRERRYGATPR